ncbi:MAG TPA: hypothetical protein VGS22_22255 [Thermoanaerobaculia bacterium]|nr:hypothetical protein [Thermoanaerobaculia bacterium]
MATKKLTTPPRATEQPPTQLKAERIQLALASLPGWALGPPRQRVEAFFRLSAPGETDRFVPFVLATCREEGAVVEMSVRENLVVVRLGGAAGVTAADLLAAQALSGSRWAQSPGAMAA